MSNLLDKASIILTPTAYNNGEALCVKPNDGSGDFDFSRNSAATRVNAQGLVENVQILSSNLVQNGDFSEEGAEEVSNGSFSQEGAELVVGGDFSNPSDWTISGQNLSISNGKGISTGSNFGAQFKQTILTINKTYKLVFDIVDYTSGAIGLTANYYGVQQTFNSVGTHTAYFTSLNQTELRLYSENFIGSIDNVSVREVGQDWTFGTGWSVGEDKAISDTTASNLTPSTVLVSGKTYKFTLDVAKISVGSFTFLLRFNGSNTVIGTINSEGSFTFYAKADATGFRLQNLSGGTTDFSITNISAKEVGQNWDLLNGTITDKYNASLTSYQNGIRVNPFTYTGTVKVTFDLVVTSGSCKFVAGGSNEQIYSTSGTKEIIVTNPSRFEFNAFNLGWVGTLDNVSAIQITDDTNLPRINYEGFSYQDALGSEEVVNGNFSDGGSNWSLGAWTAENNTATINGQSGILSQASPSLVSGKKYKWTFEITEYNSGSVKLYSGGGGDAATYESSIGIHTQYFVANGTGKYFYSNSFNGSITNVSVKEYLGQEVVPDSGCGSWLWEPQSTNTVNNSNPTNALEYSSNITKTNNTAISPDSTFNAMSFTPTATQGIHRAGYSLTAGSYSQNDIVTFSCFVKANGYNFVTVGGFFGQEKAVFNISNGTLVSQESNVINTKIVKLTNDWYRLSTTYTFQNSINNGYLYAGIYVMDTETGYAFTGDGVSGVYGYGFQAELGTGTSYIPTSGSTVTRNQDVCNNGGSLASINSTSGTLYAEVDFVQTGLTNGLYAISDGTFNNFLMVRFSPTNKIQVEASGGVNLIETNVRASGNYKTAVKYSSSGVELWVDGTKIIETSTQTSISGINQIMVAKSPFGNIVGCKTKCLAVWKEALTDAELTELTTI